MLWAQLKLCIHTPWVWLSYQPLLWGNKSYIYKIGLVEVFSTVLFIVSLWFWDCITVLQVITHWRNFNYRHLKSLFCFSKLYANLYLSQNKNLIKRYLYIRWNVWTKLSMLILEEKLVGISFLHSLFRCQGSESSCQGWWKTPLHTEPPHCSKKLFKGVGRGCCEINT